MGRDDDDLQATAIAMRRAGRTRREIREALGIGESRLSDWVRDIPPGDRSRRPRAKDEVRARARELREKWWSIPKIAEELGVARSTVWVWTKNMAAPPQTSLAERTHAGRDLWVKRRRWGREVERWRTKARAGREVGTVTDRELLLLGTVLYWAEGAKDKTWDRREWLGFVNSDPDVVRLYLRWLALLGVTPDRLRFSVQIHESADVTGAVSFWAAVADVPQETFLKTVLKRHNPRTVRKNLGGDYRGCLRIYVRDSAELYRRVEGLWLGIARSPAPRLDPVAQARRPVRFDERGRWLRHRRILARGRRRDAMVPLAFPAHAEPEQTGHHPGVYRLDGS